jgi:phosphonate transport system substrate-binding protein
MTSSHRLFGRLAPIAVLIVAAGTIASQSRLRAADTAIKVGMIPDTGATQVSIQEKGPLQAYLSTAIGRPVSLVIPTNYNATVEGLGNGSLDFAYLGGLTYVKAHASYGVIPLVQRDIDQQFHSLLFTQASSSIHSLSDLKSKRFAFGDINSTSGHLMPYRAMTQAGVDPDKDLTFRYTGSHAATVQAVASGTVDAGGADETVYKSLVADGKVDGSKLRVFYTTPAFVDYVWVARKDVDATTQRQFADAFLKLTAGRDDQILTILRGQHFVRANDAEYKDIADVARKLGMF